MPIPQDFFAYTIAITVVIQYQNAFVFVLGSRAVGKMAFAVDPFAPADHSNPPESVDCLTDGEEVVTEEMGWEDPDKLKRGITERLQKSHSPGLPMRGATQSRQHRRGELSGLLFGL
jgi:hypothetical protein